MRPFFIFLIIFLFSAIKVYAEKLEKINIYGNKRISQDTIIVFTKLKIGQNFNNENANQVIKNLYETNFFKQVSVKINSGILDIKIEENPIIQNIFITGVKNKNIIKIIEDQFTIREKGSYVESLIKNEANRINNFLRVSGYYFSKVDYQTNFNENSTVDLTYNITTGEKALIRKINFTGNKILKDNKLKRLIVSEEDKFWKFISKKKYLNKSQINLDVSLLENYFKNSGYYNVKIDSSVAKFVENNYFDLVFNINAGERIFFDKVKLILPEEYKEENFQLVLDEINEFKNQPYSLSKINKVLNEIDKIALSKQYEFINAEFKEEINGNKLNLTIIVNESKKFYVDRINIIGNVYTSEKTIRNMFIVDEGDPFNELLNTRSINKIKSSNLFSKVETEIIESDSFKKNINITVEEKPTGEISAGAGVSSTGSTFSASIKENNFGGEGIKLDTTLTVSAKSIRGGINFLIPNYNYSERDLSFDLSRTTNDYLSVSGYKNSSTNISIGTGFEYKQDFYFNPSLNIEYEDLETTSSASNILKKQEGNYYSTEFGYNLFYDLRNQGFEPTDGFYSRFNQSLPILSSNYSIYSNYDFKAYHEFSEQFIGSFSLYLAAINSIDGDDVLISDRINLPSKRLKGFERGKVGPKDGSEFIGGNYASAISFNTTLPKILPDLQALELGLFVDVGNVWSVDYDSSLDNSKLRSSTGITLDYFTPIGPINFVLSQPITKSDTDVTETFRFDIGTSF